MLETQTVVTNVTLDTQDSSAAAAETLYRYNGKFPDGFRKCASFKVPPCGKIDFAKHLLRFLVSHTAISNGKTAYIDAATDGNGNLCLRCNTVSTKKDAHRI